MLLPLILLGPGRLSLDHRLRRRLLGNMPADKAPARRATEWAMK